MNMYLYENPVKSTSVGMDRQKLEDARSEFRKQHQRGDFPGGQLVLRRGGEVVLNEVCGAASGWRSEEEIEPVLVRRETPFPVLSAGKPLGAVAIALLEERAQLEVEAPISEFIPEFARHGKGEITILDVLTHRTGISMPGLVANSLKWSDRDAILEALINTRPIYPRGTMMYAAYEYGWILAEIVFRLDGHTLAEYVYKEISMPLGLPALKFGLGQRMLEEIATQYWLGKDKVMVSGINVAENFEERNNSIEQINSMNPAVSLVSDASSLAAFYSFLVNGGITPSGERLISADILMKYTTSNVFGFDRSSRFPLNLGRGFMVGSQFASSFGWWGTRDCFGHMGGFSSMAFGDHGKKIAAAIVTNGNRDFLDAFRRFVPLIEKLRKACD